MASYTLNIATLANCPPPAELVQAMESYGLPEAEEFGAMHATATDASAFATIVRKTHQAIPRLDVAAGDITTETVEKAAAYPIGVFPRRRLLETYAGSATGLEQVAAFFAGPLHLPTVVTPIALDLPSVLEKLRTSTERFQLKRIRVSDYAHDSYMSGPYAPTFLDSEHGMDFLREHAETLTAATVRFGLSGGRVTAHLSPKACFRYSLSNEDDLPAVQAILRKLL